MPTVATMGVNMPTDNTFLNNGIVFPDRQCATGLVRSEESA